MKVFLRLTFILALLAVAAAVTVNYTQEKLKTTYIEAEVTRDDIVQSISAVGSFRPIGMVEISSSTSGQIAEVKVDFNDTVERNQPLAVIDQRVLRANLKEVQASYEVAQANARMTEARIARAQADLADAKLREEVARAAIDGFMARHGYNATELTRARSLAARQSVALSEVERAEFSFQASLSDLEVARLEQEVAGMQVQSAEAVVKMARAELSNAQAVLQQREAAVDRAKIELERATLRAPIDGFVVGRSVEVGQTVSASLEAPMLFTLAENLENMEVHAVVDESDIVRIALGQTAQVAVDALPERTFAGTVKQIRRLSDDRDGVVTYTIIIYVQNPDLILLPGMTALIDIIVNRRTGVLSLPNAALRFRPPDASARLAGLEAATDLVWVRDANGNLEPMPVKTGLTDGTVTELVSEEISEGQKIVVGTRVTREARGLFGLKLGL